MNCFGEARRMRSEFLDVEMQEERFERMGRLVGQARLKRLASAHVMVIGLGGVGSWAAESIARSGVGEVTLVDFDQVCITNFNRQLHALEGAQGQQKATIMAARLQSVNPEAHIEAMPVFYDENRCQEIFARRPDFVIDAIDNLTAKCHLINFCHNEGIPIVCSTGSAGRLDPTKIRVADLAFTEKDPMAKDIRKILRDRYGFPGPEQGPFGVPAVYSIEKWISPQISQVLSKEAISPDENMIRVPRKLILGSASFVTGSFGLFCASFVVRSLIGEEDASQI